MDNEITQNKTETRDEEQDRSKEDNEEEINVDGNGDNIVERNDENEKKEEEEMKVSERVKKKKVRRRRVSKNDRLSRVEEESDEEDRRKKKEALLERRLSWAKMQLTREDEDGDDIPILNYKSDDKKPPLEVPGEFDDAEPPREERNEEEEFEEEEDPCMTTEEKEAMYRAAMIGDIDLLEDCLDKPNADIHMIWFYDNLLVAALKAGQQEMAEFLIDNGVDYNVTAPLINITDDRNMSIECYTTTCRQLAFDKGLLEVVELIDYLNGDLFSFIKPRARVKRYRRPKPPTPEPEMGGESENDASSEASKDCSEIDADWRMKKRKKKKRRTSKDEDGNVGQESQIKERYKDVLESVDNDSGHHSFDSSIEVEKGRSSRSPSPRRKSLGSLKKRFSSSRLSISLHSNSSSPPPISKSETFLKKFVYMCSDEGYGTMSPKSSPTSFESRRKAVPITIPPRGTKSSIGLQMAASQKKSLLEQQPEKAVLKKKVKAVGSYQEESTRWYQRSNQSHGKEEQGTKTKSKDRMCDGLKENMSSTKVAKSVDASYMQMTQSSKRKLEPKFSKHYKSLDFVCSAKVKSVSVEEDNIPGKPRRPYDSMKTKSSPQIRNTSTPHHLRFIKRVW